MQQIYRRKPFGSAVSIKLQNNFIEITIWDGFFPVSLLHVSIIPFPKNISGELFLTVDELFECDHFVGLGLKGFRSLQLKLSCGHWNLWSTINHRQGTVEVEIWLEVETYPKISKYVIKFLWSGNLSPSFG